MDKNIKISDFISELISIGYSALARENGQGKLKAFKEINKGLDFLKKNAVVHTDDISKSIVTLKLLVDLREDVIKSKGVKDYQIPDIYSPVEKLNTLLIKSANQSLKDDDPNLITTECEKFLNAADEIRKDSRIKGLGLLDGKIKNVIGRLRKKANIESIFLDEGLDSYQILIEAADNMLNSGSLNQIGAKSLELKHTADELSKDFAYRTRFIKYVRRFEQSFHQKIKAKTNALLKKSNGSSFFDCQEILDELVSIKKFEEYHRKKGLTIMIRQFIKKIEKTKIVPLEKALYQMKVFVLDNISNKNWQSYELNYEKKYNSREIFQDTFYESTLKAYSPYDAVSLLKKRLGELKKLDLKDRRHIVFEQDFIGMFEKLIKVFDRLSVGSKKSKI
ncbi:MAG: hypothetical protein GY699_00105 [Desulfobacteraceae bacterium]|nr:hypothetical protein [Desulfobacteraceae bacterium]